MRLIALLACLLAAIPIGVAAQDQPASGPSAGAGNAVARTATRALLGDDFPDVQDVPPPADVRGTSESQGFISEPRIFGRAIDFANRTLGEGVRMNNGFYPDFSNMVTGSGWISVGPGYRHWLFSERAIMDVSTAVSWRGYKMAQGRFEFPALAHSRLTLGSQVFWQDAMQVTYFGRGPDSPEESRSEYRMKSTDVVAYMTVRPIPWLAFGGRAGWLQQPTLLSPAGPFLRDYPAAHTQFPDDAAYSLAQQPSYLHGEVSMTGDTRDTRSHPKRGGVYRAAATVYSDRDAGMFSFQRYEAEAAHFVPLASDRIVLAFHGWAVATATGAGQQVPFYLMPSLGGHNSLRSYTDYRFHDRNMVVANAEARFALMRHVDLAAFADAGNVAASFSDLNLDKRDWGLGIRLHAERATFARIDAAHGTDGWKILFRTSDPLHLSRLSRRTATAPFVQ